MINTPRISVRPDHPDFVDLDWSRPISEWTSSRLVSMPEGIHRHPVVFVAYSQGIYAIKELPIRFARHEFETLGALEEITSHVAVPVGLVERPWIDKDSESSGTVITAYVSHAFPYRHLVSGHDFGQRRDALLDAFAGLLVELHLHGFYWGDCSLSNTLYRWDASSIEAVMIDAETSSIYSQLSKGQRLEDLAIMELNVAGEMADIAAEHGVSIDDADLALGSDITARYVTLWDELTTSLIVTAGDHYRIRHRIERLNTLGFAVDSIDLIPVDDGVNVKMRVRVGGRQYHSERLRQMVGIDTSENQARSILSDIAYHEAKVGSTSATRRSVGTMNWRSQVLEPLIDEISVDLPDQPVYQAYCDFLAYRLRVATERSRDVDNNEAYEAWKAAGFPRFKGSDHPSTEQR
ncbi:MAG: DUF4032 domain-containing protein [Actinomycetia bacterium]|nr:DUF4032 domain-containing protein [Actinomycetes bacterium]